ncbi:2896_t:CDS:2, partial [Paraglomus occultum]
MHTLDLANFPVTDTLKMLASLLAKMTQANDQIKSRAHSHSDSSSTSTSSPSFTRFHARSVPSIDIYSYLARILKYCPTTNECFLSLLVYFDRMSKNALATTGKPFSIDSFNIHRLIISGIMVSSKFFSDVFFTNSRYAKVGGLPVSELNHLELEFLILNEFRLSISVEELQRYGDQLLRHWVMEEEMRSNGSIYDSIRFGPNSPSGRWDPHEKNSISKRSRRHPSSDDTNTSKGGGPKAVKEEDQDNHHYSRTHRRDSSLSSAKSLNISSYHTPLTSSPTSFASPRKAASSGRAHSTSGTSPNSSTVHLNGTSSQAITNGSPMRGPYPSTAFNTHHMHYPNVHKAYPSAHHHNSQHQRSVSLESTIKRASSSGSLLNLNRSRSGDLTDDLQQYHHQSSPKQINPEDVAYRTAAPPFPNAPPPQITTTSALNVTNPKYASSTGNLSNGASHNISSMIRRMSHDSPVNSFQQVPNTYHYSTYPPQPNANSSQPSTSMSTFPP